MPDMLTRRELITRLGAAVAVAHGAGALSTLLDVTPADAQAPPLDALNGLLAFVVPGPDAFSVAQGVTDQGPGGVDAGVLPALLDTLDATPSPVMSVPTSFVVAGLLDQVAASVNPAAQGFAALSFGEKMQVFAFLESNPATAALAQALLTGTAFLAYSEAGAFNSSTRTIVGTPTGWALTDYSGVSDGRDEFVGYYRGHRKATR